ncbi:MAG: hypothetical protein IT292_12470 [Deltaproteobacteria bacterium]|nr:hypothetical protein [Deltaproteobacteria bacterium]
MKLVFLAVIFSGMSLALTSCSPSNIAEPDTARVIYEPTPPEGVVRYCWEEPIVDEEKVDAGLDSEGKWYNPGHVAIREVRMGKWRPCREITSRTYGRYGNER